jgi:hypothetical protein
MHETRIILSGLWAATMLTYLLGDVLRIFAGDYEAGKVAGGVAMTQVMLLGIAVMMLLPILMLVSSLILPQTVVRWAAIIIALFLIILNLFGLPYPGHYDNFLIGVSFVFNGLTIWYAWQWQ